ncbi:MAG TPA: hypothetical protein VLX85_07255 [Stellaceae bacterium]|nr:hypothetical protein [Stellaceae bacterium]
MAAAFRRSARALIALALAALAGCGVRIRQESLTDRCADVMLQAFPQSGIKVTKEEALAPPTASIASFAAAVEGVRERLPEGSPLRRDVAVQCAFEDGILTNFRWTKGPLH